MEQRRLRLGDILDDYCPRERRVTNHVVVAMIEDDVKQTRCTTCEAEHVYKGGKEPRRRSRKDSPAGLFREVLAGMPEQDGAPAAMPAPDSRGDDLRSEDELQAAMASQDQPVAQDEPVQTVEATPDEPEPPVPPVDDGHFHRRLIRAQLPRPEGQKEVRQVPDFTIRHQNNGRGPFRGRGPSGAGQPGGAGDRPHGRRFAGGGNPGMPGNRGPSTGSGRGPSTGSGRGPSHGPGRGPSPGSGRGPSHGPGRGPSAGPGRGPRKRSR